MSKKPEAATQKRKGDHLYIEPLNTPIAIIDKTPTGINFSQAAVTALFAVASGFILYLIKTYIDETWLRRHREFRKLKADIAYTLVMYANVYTNQGVREELVTEASAAIRNCAARLSSFIEEWPKNIGGIPKREELKKASSEMIGLSNRVCAKSDTYQIIFDNDRSIQTIKNILGLKE